MTALFDPCVIAASRIKLPWSRYKRHKYNTMSRTVISLTLTELFDPCVTAARRANAQGRLICGQAWRLYINRRSTLTATESQQTRTNKTYTDWVQELLTTTIRYGKVIYQRAAQEVGENGEAVSMLSFGRHLRRRGPGGIVRRVEGAILRQV